MAVTKLQIINGALASINTSQVTQSDLDLVSTTPAAAPPEATNALALFDGLFRALIDLAEWPWAITRTTLSPAAVTTNGGDYSHTVTLPGDLVRLVGMVKCQDWKQEGNLVYLDAKVDPDDDSDVQDVVVRYLTDSETLSLANMSGGAQYLLQASLGISLATNFLRDEEQALRLTRFYEFQLRIALTGVKKFVELPTTTFETALLLPTESRRR